MTRHVFEMRHRLKHAQLLNHIASGRDDEAKRLYREIWELAREFAGS